MATPHVRHQLHLHRPQIAPAPWVRPLLPLALLVFLAGPALAQRKRSDTIDRNRKGHIKGVVVEKKGVWKILKERAKR